MLSVERLNTMRRAMPYVFIIAISVVVMLAHDRLFPDFELNGDNEYYKYAFEQLSDFSWTDLWGIDFSLAQIAGSGSEPVSALVFYLFAQVVDFRTFHLLVQLTFLICLGVCLRRNVEQWQIVFVLCVMTFYVFIVSTLTKRVAIGMTFVFLGLSYRKYGMVFFVLSVLSHFQIALFYLAANALSLLRPVTSVQSMNSRSRVILVVLAFLALAVMSHVSTPLFDKLYSHIQSFGFRWDAVKLLVWPLLHLSVNRELDQKSIAAYGVLFMAAIVFGPGRLNFMAYFMFMYLNDSRAITLMHVLLVPYSAHQFLVFADIGYDPGVVTDQIERFQKIHGIGH